MDEEILKIINHIKTYLKNPLLIFAPIIVTNICLIVKRGQANKSVESLISLRSYQSKQIIPVVYVTPSRYKNM